METHKVYIVVLNWNGWQYTLECLESLFRQNYAAWRVIVCDNASTDGSWDYLKAWAEGRVGTTIAEDFPLRDFVVPGVPKPIPYVEYTKNEAEAGGRQDEQDEPLVLIQTRNNLGFAGGNNVALRYASMRKDCNYIWVLNNDTIVPADTLSILVEKLRSDPAYGMCGATIVYQHAPHLIQTRGGSIHLAWLGRTRHIGFLEPSTTKTCERTIEARMACVVGACILIPAAFVKKVGLLSEIYFLYFEDLDWAIRARQSGYRLAYASQAIVYHKEGATIGGTNVNRSKKSWAADYFELRNRVVLTRKFYPWALPIVCLSLLGSLANRVRRQQWKRLGLVSSALLDAFRVRLDTT